MGKNVEPGGGLRPKQNKVIAALLECSTIGQACEQVKISRSTLARWMEQPAFNQALTEARAGIFHETLRVLLAGNVHALATLHAVMVDPNVSAGTRRQAAVDWLSTCRAIFEKDDIERRVAALEEAANVVKKS